MAVKQIIDTWGWLTLHDKSERYHQEATKAYQRAIAQNGLSASSLIGAELVKCTCAVW